MGAVNRRGARAVCVVESDVWCLCAGYGRVAGTYRVDFAKESFTWSTARAHACSTHKLHALRPLTLARQHWPAWPISQHTPVPVEKSRKNSSDWPWRLEKRVLQIILEGTSLLH